MIWGYPYFRNPPNEQVEIILMLVIIFPSPNPCSEATLDLPSNSRSRGETCCPKHATGCGAVDVFYSAIKIKRCQILDLYMIYTYSLIFCLVRVFLEGIVRQCPIFRLKD